MALVRYTTHPTPLYSYEAVEVESAHYFLAVYSYGCAHIMGSSDGRILSRFVVRLPQMRESTSIDSLEYGVIAESLHTNPISWHVAELRRSEVDILQRNLALDALPFLRTSQAPRWWLR